MLLIRLIITKAKIMLLNAKKVILQVALKTKCIK